MVTWRALRSTKSCLHERVRRGAQPSWWTAEYIGGCRMRPNAAGRGRGAGVSPNRAAPPLLRRSARPHRRYRSMPGTSGHAYAAALIGEQRDHRVARDRDRQDAGGLRIEVPRWPTAVFTIEYDQIDQTQARDGARRSARPFEDVDEPERVHCGRSKRSSAQRADRADRRRT